MPLFGASLPAKAKETLLKFKNILKTKGSTSVRALKQRFNRADANKNKKLCIDEFLAVLQESGLFPTRDELQALFRYFDIDGTGQVNFEAFVNSLKEPLSER
eukprot:GDKI01033417.1.p2 GENE.GDKI01033417.1~~GDKI01033417.1.p2  ORF type:complete len:102 (+),score=29.14 GDKI01033417.1:75-380(+)